MAALSQNNGGERENRKLIVSTTANRPVAAVKNSLVGSPGGKTSASKSAVRVSSKSSKSVTFKSDLEAKKSDLEAKKDREVSKKKVEKTQWITFELDGLFLTVTRCLGSFLRIRTRCPVPRSA